MRFPLVSMILDKESLIPRLPVRGTRHVFSLRRFAVGLGTFQKFLLANGNVLVFARPTAEDGGLKGTPVAEAQSPWFLPLEPNTKFINV